MAKLNQIIAVANGKKSRAQAGLTEIHHKLQKDGLLTGLSRTYAPKDDEGERLPAESKRVQFTVDAGLKQAASILSDLWDVVATQDAANCEAKADVRVDGKTIVASVPVTSLLFLEKQLTDAHTLIEKLPTLDPAYQWTFNAEADCYATEPRETTRTKKTPKAFEASPATKEHPAQVQVFMEDVLVGYWKQTDFSGAIPAQRKNELLRRVEKLQDAVKRAREEANGVDVKDVSVGKPIFEYLLS